MTKYKSVTKVIERMNSEEYYKVEAVLHLHYDKDDQYDYTGEHSIRVNFWKQEKHCFVDGSIDLNGVNEKECKNILQRVVKLLKEADEKVEYRIITHRWFPYAL